MSANPYALCRVQRPGDCSVQAALENGVKALMRKSAEAIAELLDAEVPHEEIEVGPMECRSKDGGRTIEFRQMIRRKEARP